MTANDELELLAVAREAAEAAADELRARFGERPAGVRSKSGPTDLVSDADLAAESAIRSVLGARRPGDAILGEEGGETGEGELRWVVDPLDGTINYLYRIPAFAVSVAVEDASGTLAGVVLDPIAEERFEATRSGEPTLNGQPIRARRPRRIARVRDGRHGLQLRRGRASPPGRALCPGCCRGSATSVASAQRRSISAGAPVAATTPTSSAALNPWDVAAGSLIARRAGLEVRDLAPAEGKPAGTLAAPASFVDELLELDAGSSPAPLNCRERGGGAIG